MSLSTLLVWDQFAVPFRIPFQAVGKPRTVTASRRPKVLAHGLTDNIFLDDQETRTW